MDQREFETAKKTDVDKLQARVVLLMWMVVLNILITLVVLSKLAP